MRSRRFAWIVVALVALLVLRGLRGLRRHPVAEGIPMTRPRADEVVRMFGGGPSDDPARDATLRRQVVGRWGRSDSDRVYLDFDAAGGLRGADMTSDPVAVARG